MSRVYAQHTWLWSQSVGVVYSGRLSEEGSKGRVSGAAVSTEFRQELLSTIDQFKQHLSTFLVSQDCPPTAPSPKEASIDKC